VNEEDSAFLDKKTYNITWFLNCPHYQV